MARRKSAGNGVQYCSAQDFDASSFILGMPDEFGLRAVLEQMPPTKPIFCEARLWATRQFFLREIIKLRYAIYNFGFAITAASGKKSDLAAVQKWKDENENLIADFVRDAWGEWNIMDNAVALWRRETARPLIMSTERCKYTDKFAVEKLRFTHGLDEATIDQLKLSREEAAELKAHSEIELVKQGNVYTKRSFFFEVVKREKVGMGFAWPTLRAIFNQANGMESLQIGDRQMADATRTVYELHQVGHEIKSGNLAGRPLHFLKEKRAEAIKAQVKQDRKLISRLVQLIVNFDHKISYPRPDPNVFAADRYESFLNQMIVWSLPLGQMIFAKGVNPFLMTLLKAQAATERGFMGPFIKRVLTKSLRPPADIAVTFGDDVFWDSRLLLDVLKTGLSMGPLSQGTWLTMSGFNKSLERQYKEEEAKLPREVVTPLFDAAHGDPDKKPGPKTGSKNKEE